MKSLKQLRKYLVNFKGWKKLTHTCPHLIVQTTLGLVLLFRDHTLEQYDRVVLGGFLKVVYRHFQKVRCLAID